MGKDGFVYSEEYEHELKPGDPFLIRQSIQNGLKGLFYGDNENTNGVAVIEDGSRVG